MARTDTLNNFLTDVAEAIREKKGTTGTIPASSFDTEIASIESGGGGETELPPRYIHAIEVTSNNLPLIVETNILDFMPECFKCKSSASGYWLATKELHLVGTATPQYGLFQEYCFQNWRDLVDVYLYSSYPYWCQSTTIFNGCSNLTHIYVPDELVDTYKTQTNWTAFADKIFPLSEATNRIK